MTKETYPCYVRIGETASKEVIEIPTEDDGSMLLSSINAQFPSAIGLRFKAESGAWRGLHVSGGVLQPPLEGWGDVEYSITKGGKRKGDLESGPAIKKALSDSDLIVLGLPYATTDEDLKTYFEQYGELQHYEVKLDTTTQKSKGFGFIRYKTAEAVEAVLAVPHSIDGRRCEVRFPKRTAIKQDTPTKLFIGRLPKGTTVDDLNTHFSEFGNLTDVYIPSEFRGFGFVTFGSVIAARNCLASTHVLKDSYLNVCHPTPKSKQTDTQANQNKNNGYYTNGYANTGKVA